MIRDVIKDYKSSIETPKDMACVLSKYRQNLMKEYSTTYGWHLEEALPALDMILRLDKAVRYYEWKAKYQQ